MSFRNQVDPCEQAPERKERERERERGRERAPRREYLLGYLGRAGALRWAADSGSLHVKRECRKMRKRDTGKETEFMGLRPSLLDWRPLLLGWRPSLLGWRPLLLGWRPSHLNATAEVLFFCLFVYQRRRPLLMVIAKPRPGSNNIRCGTTEPPVFSDDPYRRILLVRQSALLAYGKREREREMIERRRPCLNEQRPRT